MHAINSQSGSLIRLSRSIGVGLLLLLVLGFQQCLAFQATYTFRVTVSENQLKAGDRIGVRGTHADLGEWKETKIWLRQNAEKEWEGQLAIKKKEADDVLYKYVIETSTGQLIWEAGANRVLSQEQKKKKNDQVDRFGRIPEQALLSQAMEVKLQVDLSSFYIPVQELDQLVWMSDLRGVGFVLDNNEGLPLLPQTDNPSIWEASLPLQVGDRRDFSFKLAFIHMGEVYWESLAGHANHVGLLANEQNATISMLYDNEKGRFTATLDQTIGVELDQFEPIKNLYGRDYETTEYAYMELLHQVMLGEPENAWTGYQTWKKANPAGREIDDMVFIYSDYLAEQTSVEVAEQFLEQEVSKEPNTYRKVQLRYHHGELLQRNGQYERGRKVHKRLVAEFTPTIDKQALKAAKTPEERRRLRKELPKSEFEAQLNYAQQALAWSYLSETEPDSIKLGEAWLASNTKSGTSSFKRHSLKQYIRHMSRKGEQGLVREAFERYVQEGTSEQQTQAKLWQLQQELDWGETKKAAVMWDALNTELGLGLIALSELEELGQIQDGTQEMVQRLRGETQLSSAFKTQRKKNRLLQRMQLKRAQVLLNEEFLEPAEAIEPSIEQQILPQREQGQHKELKERLKERRAEKEREKKRKKQEEEEQKAKELEGN